MAMRADRCAPAQSREDIHGSRLAAGDALSICVAMVASDPSLAPAAARMWRALAPFVSALSEEESRSALGLLKEIARRDGLADLRRLRRQAARRGQTDVVTVLDQWLIHPGVL